MSKEIKTFELRVYADASMSSEPEYTASGVGDEWEHYLRIKIPGFDGAISVALESLWVRVIRQELTQYVEAITGYETIVKMGGTMQLKSKFTVSIAIQYVDSPRTPA
jgi:hypothetical protein